MSTAPRVPPRCMLARCHVHARGRTRCIAGLWCSSRKVSRKPPWRSLFAAKGAPDRWRIGGRVDFQDFQSPHDILRAVQPRHLSIDRSIPYSSHEVFVLALFMQNAENCVVQPTSWINSGEMPSSSTERKPLPEIKMFSKPYKVAFHVVIARSLGRAT